MDSETLYRHDLAQVADISPADLDMLLQAARSGDQQAKERIILSQSGVICAYAARRQRVGCELMDLVSFGNLVFIEMLDEALAHANPIGYLLKFVWHEMGQYRRRVEHTITPPSTPGDDPYDMSSISRFIDEFGECTLAMPAAQEPPTEDNLLPLYEALTHLPAPARTLLCRLYGLCGYGVESLATIAGGDSTTKPYQAAKMRKLAALKKLRAYLEQHHPAFTRRHASEFGASKRKPEIHLIIPERTLRKLHEAEKELRRRELPLSMNKLRQLSGVHTRYATAYLRQIAAPAC